MKRYLIKLKIRGLDLIEEYRDTFIECENFVLSQPYDWFKVYRDGILISEREYNF
jgi:hypothetical protein